MREHAPALVLVTLALVFAGPSCSGKPPGNAELKSEAERARSEAALACEARDAKAARKAAERAIKARDTVRARLKSEEEGRAPEGELAALRELVVEIEEAAAAAERSAALAGDFERCDKKLRSWKLKGYRAARGAALKIAMGGMSLALDRLSGRSFASLSPGEQSTVELAEMLTEVARLPNGEPDWAALRSGLSSGVNLPPEASFALCAAFVLAGHDDLALQEAEGLAPRDVSDPQVRPLWQAARGVVYQLNDLPDMAAVEFESIEGSEAAAPGGPCGPEFQAFVHLLLAAHSIDKMNFKRADREIMQAVRLWPNNPVGPLLTGEVMVGQGQYEKAAESLEEWQRSHGTDLDPWLVEQMQKRAREIRDSKGPVRPLFHDPAFLRDLAVHYVSAAAKKSAEAQKLRDFLGAARGFGGDVLKHVPGMGADAPAQEQEQ